MNPAGKPEQPPLKRKRTESNTKAISEPSKTPKLDKDLNQVSPSSNPTTVNDAAETNGKSDLPILLDFTHANSTSEISARFDQLGTALLHDYQIVAIHGTNNRQSLYEVLELEFYLIKPGSHEDPFTHGSEEQRRSGRW